MCFAMWVAAASFFWGPPQRVPEAIRIPALQAVAVLLPIVAMLYWLWRIRVRQAFRGIVTASPVSRMNIQTNDPTSRKPLRLWPAIAIAIVHGCCICASPLSRQTPLPLRMLGGSRRRVC